MMMIDTYGKAIQGELILHDLKDRSLAIEYPVVEETSWNVPVHGLVLYCVAVNVCIVTLSVYVYIIQQLLILYRKL